MFYKYSRLSVLAAIFFFVSAAYAQEKHKGIVLYEQGKYTEAADLLAVAVKSLPMKTDAALWNYLGLAYHHNNEAKNAIKSFERAVKLDPKSSAYRTNLAYSYLLNRQDGKARSSANRAIELDPSNVTAYQLRGSLAYWDGRLDAAKVDALKARELNPKFAPAYRLEADVLVGQLGQRTVRGETVRENLSFLEKAVNTLELGITNAATPVEKAQLAEHLETLNAFYKHFSKPSAPVENKVEPEPGVTPYRIISKTPAKYTDSARIAGTQGTIRIVLILGADGNIGPMLVVKSLPNGLTAQAVAAARKVRFEPKIVNGKPVSVVATVEYNFNLY